ncbi:MAG: tRNA uridine-5-carboxymethylaminomethyl(34) synthesis GTPase MnmE [Spirochaetia bacterium]|nr:tRNA uridine-5-carboxymethylaminomethyl(34) synthesis GTPase MnmE [Spirochaetia bacterium]
MNDAVCAVATPNGHSAIGIVRLSGNNCHSLLWKIFQPKNIKLSLENIESSSAVYGKIIWENHIIDDVIVLIFHKHRSFTGEEYAEIQGHGNPLILRKIIQILFKTGFREAHPGEFTYRAYLAGKIDLTQAEAIREIVEARSERQINRAILQKEGLLKKRLNQFRSNILNVTADFTAELDFSDEGLEFAGKDRKIEILRKIKDEAEVLINHSRRNFLFKNGIEIVLIGAPNAGKSSLMNAMTGKNRSIVSEIPGTTRDYIDAPMEISGMPVVLVDTAGIRKTQHEEVEKLGMEKTIEKYHEADLRLLLIDSSEKPSNSLFNELNVFLHPDHLHRSIIVLNKWDIVHPEWEQNRDKADFWTQFLQKSDHSNDLVFNQWEKNMIFLSAKTLFGLDSLFDRLQEIIENMIPPSETLSMAQWQMEIMEKIQLGLDEAIYCLIQDVSSEIIVENLNQIVSNLSEITGEISNEDLLGRIFSRFCIGK